MKGLNWMGGALVVGGAATGFFLLGETFPAVEPIANLCTLLAFLCCYRADRYLIGLEARIGRVGMTVLALQAVTMILEWTHVFGIQATAVMFSALIAFQVGNTARLIHSHGAGKARRPTRVTVVLMACVVVAGLLRGACAACGMLTSPWAATLNLVSYSSFVSFGIALAFAFFWRTTTKLSGELEHMASTDPLTRVYNRRIFLQWCESEQTRSQRLHAPFSVLMVDFDHFKKINDTYGHHVGDQVLCAAVERIQDSIRGIDVLCRWGGEEFAVLLPNASEEATLIVAERVRRNIRLVDATDSRFLEEAHEGLQLSASIGTATYCGDGDSFEQMLQRADEALYKAKRAGRNRVVGSACTRETLGAVSGQLTLETP